MVTMAALALALSEPARAARRAAPSIWGELFGPPAPKPRKRQHLAHVPLPRPRPADAPPRQAEPPAQAREAPVATPGKPAGEGPAHAPATATPEPERTASEKPPPPSACRQALTDDIAIAPSIPDIHGPGGCGGSDLVRLEAIVLPDRHRVPVMPPATLRCPMATAIADWIRTDIVSLTAGLGTEPAGLENHDSYECRTFNHIAGAHLSEHGHANALDVRAIRLANGRSIVLTDRNVLREVRESILHSACVRFTTVLGPGSDGYHEEHIHLDLMERRNGYRICQWDVWDPLPKIAPLLPAARPNEANKANSE